MPEPTYPTAQHLMVALKSNPLWPEDETLQQFALFQADIAAKGAAALWERKTFWSPFLAGTEATEREFDGPDDSGLLDFRGGAVEVVSVTRNGRLLVAGTDYYLYPRSAPSRGEAYTGIQFRGGSAWWGNYSSEAQIKVVARWGRVALVPDDVFQVVQKQGIASLMDNIENSPGIASISMDSFSKGNDPVGVRTQKDIAETGGKDFVAMAMLWRRDVSC